MKQKNTVGRALVTIPPMSATQPTRTTRGADVAGIVEVEHVKYLIKAGWMRGICIARAFPKPPSKAQGVFAEAEGDTEQAAIAALKRMIEARDVRRKKVRRWEDRASISVPTEEEFVEALHQAPLSRPQVAMLKAHSCARDGAMTSDQLAGAAGYRSRETAFKVFCKAGDLVADYLGIEVDEDAHRDREGSALILAFKSIQADDAPAIWIMHQELRIGVRTALR